MAGIVSRDRTNPDPRPRPPLAGARWTVALAVLLHALLLAWPLGWLLLPEVAARRPVQVVVERPAPTPPRSLAARRPPTPPKAAAPQAQTAAPQVEAPPPVPTPPPVPPPTPVVAEVPPPSAPKPLLEVSPRRVPPPVQEESEAAPPRPRQDLARRQPPPTAIPTPAPKAAPADPADYLAKLYANLSPAPGPGMTQGEPSGPADLTDLFNRAGGTPGAALILPLNPRDGFSFRARQEAFAGLGLKLRRFYSDHTLYNRGDGPAQGVRTERGVERFKPRVPPGDVIQIGVLGDSDEALAQVDRRMTLLEEDYLRRQGLLGRVDVRQVEYKVVFGRRGYELVVGNILYTPRHAN
ncbi:hypothetical protein HS125_18040 [bacterium]|nr:hypothetical protein [bacterium]